MIPRPVTTFFNDLGRRLAYFYLRHLMLSDIEWTAEVPPGPKILAANHPTTSDPFFAMSWPFEPVHILITEQAFKVPVVGAFLRLAGHIPVRADRGREAFDAALELLREGRTVGIFPEGALSEEDGQIVTSRTGAVRLATTAGVPILPMGIALDQHFVSRHELPEIGERMRWFWLGAYEATMGAPMHFDHGPDDREAVRASTDALMAEIERLQDRSAQRLLDAAWPLRKQQAE